MRLFFLIKIISLCICIIILRGILPRYRIDSLVNLTWKNIIFFLLLFFFFNFIIFVVFNF